MSQPLPSLDQSSPKSDVLASRPSTRINIAARASGRLVKIPVKRGADVASGATLARQRVVVPAGIGLEVHVAQLPGVASVIDPRLQLRTPRRGFLAVARRVHRRSHVRGNWS